MKLEGERDERVIQKELGQYLEVNMIKMHRMSV